MNWSYRDALLAPARTFAGTGDWQRARLEYESLRSFLPGDPEVLEPLAICYRNLGDARRANSILQEALEACVD
jgi:Flp pilus assembly protein TadD